jgi:NodT family efflux transporter outer membrane factor (OMF) lipoprotein
MRFQRFPHCPNETGLGTLGGNGDRPLNAHLTSRCLQHRVPASRLAGGFGWLLLLALLVSVATGCATSPDSQTARLEVDPPQTFDATGRTNRFPTTAWLSDFANPRLLELVEEALSRNLDLQAAAARVEAAAANRRITAAARLPQLGATAAASRRDNASDLGFGIIRHDKLDNISLGLNLAWEVDLWGKLKNRTQAAIAEYEAETNVLHAARLSLAANTLKAWFSAVTLQLQLQLAEETLAVFEKNLTVVEGSYKRGLPNRALDVRLTRANVEGARGTVEARRRQRDAAGRSLEVLLGRYPADAIVLTTNLPPLHRDVPPGLPSELLNRRPDIVAAERRLAASLERVKGARKDLLPTISLSASGGTVSTDLRELLDTDRIFWNIAGNLAQPLFQGGRLRAGVDLAQANNRQAVATFSQTVLTAFQEVETFLAAEDFLRREAVALERAAAESIGGEQLAWQQYQRGLVDIITVLESQRRAFNARSSLLNVINDRLQNRINLHLALGGDFTTAGPEIDTTTANVTTPDARPLASLAP